jgi:hypothetical protein
MFIASFEHSVELAVLTDMHVMFILLICSFTLTSSRIQKCVGDLCSAELRTLGSLMPMRRPPKYYWIYLMSPETQLCFHVSSPIYHNKWETTKHSPGFLSLTVHPGSRTLHNHNCYNLPFFMPDNNDSCYKVPAPVHLRRSRWPH